MSEYKIFSDSTTDLSPALIQELDVEIIPLIFIMNGVSYLNYPDERNSPARNSTKEFVQVKVPPLTS